MVVVWGSGNYGKCDEVPGLCHVVTRFGHLYYIPLIPTKSYAVISEDGDGFRGAEIPMSLKSVLLGWLRAALVIGLIVGGIATVIMFMEPNPSVSPFLPLAGTIAALVVLVTTYRLRFFGLAGRERALQLATHLGLDEEGQQVIEQMYDAMATPTPDDDFAYSGGFTAEDPRFENIEN